MNGNLESANRLAEKLKPSFKPLNSELLGLLALSSDAKMLSQEAAMLRHPIPVSDADIRRRLPVPVYASIRIHANIQNGQR